MQDEFAGRTTEEERKRKARYAALLVAALVLIFACCSGLIYAGYGQWPQAEEPRSTVDDGEPIEAIEEPAPEEQ